MSTYRGSLVPSHRSGRELQAPGFGSYNGSYNPSKSWSNMVSEELIAELKEAFEIFDDDGDGHITITELRETMRTMGIVTTDSELGAMFDEIDTDGDRTIDFAEFLSFMTIHLEEARTSDATLHEAFRQFDSENKGYLTPSDVQRAVSILGPDARREYDQLLREADLDRDGKITFQEFANIIVSGNMPGASQSLY